MQSTFQLRWYVRTAECDRPERVLQFRTAQTVTDYGVISYSGDFRTTTVWSEWIDVPTVVEATDATTN
jgi:hypothetical protein